MRPLTIDMSDAERRPYFLWDEDVSVGELRAILRDAPEEAATRLRLLGKMLREARDLDVWAFVTPHAVERALPALGRRLGRRRPFWEYLLGGWRADGLLRPE